MVSFQKQQEYGVVSSFGNKAKCFMLIPFHRGGGEEEKYTKPTISLV